MPQNVRRTQAPRTWSQRWQQAHCAAGRGRTGTILAAYLIKRENLTADQAIKRIRSIRPGSIQSDRQELALDMYEKYIKSKTKNQMS